MKKIILFSILICSYVVYSQDNNVTQSTSISLGGKSGLELGQEANKAQGMSALGRGKYEVVQVGANGFVSMSALRKRAEEQISKFATNNNLTYKLINSEEQKGFGIYPKIKSTYQMFDLNGNIFLSDEDKAKERESVIKDLKQIKELFDMGILSKEEYEVKKAELVKFIK